MRMCSRRHRELRALAVALSMLAPMMSVSIAAVSGGVAHAATPSGSSVFVPVDHVRLANTIMHTGYSVPTRGTYKVVITGRASVPVSATEAVVNVSIVNPKGFGGATVYESGQLPRADWDVVAEKAGQIVSNLVHVPIGTDGAIAIKTSTTMGVIVDLEGFYVPALDDTAAGRFQSLGVPSVRAIRSRAQVAGADTTVDLGTIGGNAVVPSSAAAVLLTVSVDHAGAGIWHVYGAGASMPATFALTNDASSTMRSNQVMVRLVNGSTSVHIHGTAAARVTVDVIGWFTDSSAQPSTDGMFIRTPHARKLDTRSGRYIAQVGASSFEFGVGAPADVQAVVANVMWSSAWLATTATVGAAGIPGAVPLASVERPGRAIAAHVVAPVSNRGAVVSSPQGGHFSVDVEGWYLGATGTAVSPVFSNPVQAPAVVKAVQWTDRSGTHTLEVRRPSSVTNTNLEPIADAGKGAAYNDMSTLGKAMNVIVFAHRTKQPPYCRRYVGWPCTGPFRDINSMKVGAKFKLQDTKGHWWTYQVSQVGVARPQFATINAISAKYSPVTAQLIACSKADGTPTSLYYRYVVTGRLVGFA